MPFDRIINLKSVQFLDKGFVPIIRDYNDIHVEFIHKAIALLIISSNYYEYPSNDKHQLNKFENHLSELINFLKDKEIKAGMIVKGKNLSNYGNSTSENSLYNQIIERKIAISRLNSIEIDTSGYIFSASKPLKKNLIENLQYKTSLIESSITNNFEFYKSQCSFLFDLAYKDALISISYYFKFKDKNLFGDSEISWMLNLYNNANITKEKKNYIAQDFKKRLALDAFKNFFSNFFKAEITQKLAKLTVDKSISYFHSKAFKNLSRIIIDISSKDIIYKNKELIKLKLSFLDSFRDLNNQSSEEMDNKLMEFIKKFKEILNQYQRIYNIKDKENVSYIINTETKNIEKSEIYRNNKKIQNFINELYSFIYYEINIQNLNYMQIENQKFITFAIDNNNYLKKILSNKISQLSYSGKYYMQDFIKNINYPNSNKLSIYDLRSKLEQDFKGNKYLDTELRKEIFHIKSLIIYNQNMLLIIKSLELLKLDILSQCDEVINTTYEEQIKYLQEIKDVTRNVEYENIKLSRENKTSLIKILKTAEEELDKILEIFLQLETNDLQYKNQFAIIKNFFNHSIQLIKGNIESMPMENTIKFIDIKNNIIIKIKNHLIVLDDVKCFLNDYLIYYVQSSLKEFLKINETETKNIQHFFSIYEILQIFYDESLERKESELSSNLKLSSVSAHFVITK